MKSFFLLASMVLATAAFAQQSAPLAPDKPSRPKENGIFLITNETMPLALCIPAAEAAKSKYQTQKEQLQFLSGFRQGAEDSAVGRIGIISSKSEPITEGYRHAISLLGPGGPLQKKMRLSHFGYSWLDWAKGMLSLKPEQSHFTPDGRQKPYWIVFPDDVKSQLERIPTGGRREGVRVWVKGWLSPEGRFGHFGSYPRQLVVSEIYKPQPLEEPSKK